jgi:Holliday junction resolvase RusA-like endonuclease
MIDPASSALASSASSTGREDAVRASFPPVFSVSLPAPPSLNGNYINKDTGGRARAKHYDVWLGYAGNAINRARYEVQGWITIETPVVVIMQIDRSREDRDIDNCIKAIFDALQKNGVIKDDNQVSAVFVGWSPKSVENIARVAVFHVGESPYVNFEPVCSGAATGQVRTMSGNAKETENGR